MPYMLGVQISGSAASTRGGEGARGGADTFNLSPGSPNGVKNMMLAATLDLEKLLLLLNAG